MHNCKTDHPGKSHRRRNRALRKALEPLHWWSDHRAVFGDWGTGVRRRLLTSRPMPMAALATAGGGVPIAQVSERRIGIFQPSEIRRWAASLQRFVSFTRKSSA